MQNSQGIINYPTQLHLVGHFRILYHDARKHNIKFIFWVNIITVPVAEFMF